MAAGKLLFFSAAFLVALAVIAPCSSAAAEASVEDGSAPWPWWFWPLLLFVFCFVLGIIAVLAGVGGGVLYVPLVSAFFPFHFDFVRGTGLLVALAGALAAGPGLLKRNLANLRLAMPVALIASSCAIVGALAGLALPTNIVQTALGATIILIVALIFFSKNLEKTRSVKKDRVAALLKISGTYLEPFADRTIQWKAYHTVPGMILFVVIGVMAGMFGIGAGWANVPVLNLVMGVPLKIAVGTSKFLLSITDTSAAWIYLNQGCVIPLIAVPSIVGLMLGSFVGVKLLVKTKPEVIRYIVIVVLLFAGVRTLLKGLGI